MNACKLKKQLILHLPYLLAGLLSANLGEAWRMAEGADLSEKIRSLMVVMPTAFSNLLPGFHLLDLLVGGCCAERLCGWRCTSKAKTLKNTGTVPNTVQLVGVPRKILNHLSRPGSRTISC